VSALSKWHREVDEMGEGKCSVPMWSGGCPDGFCDRPAYGEPPPGKTIRRWDGYEYREDGRYAGYVPALACVAHGGPKVRTYMDGNAWCAVHPGFINLQESPAGFGPTKDEAIAELAKEQP
jgi:hypothetical protein